MAYRHKLSCRLALLRDALTVFLSVALAATCEWPSAPASPVAAIVVVPDSLTLDPAQNSKFAAYGRTANGDSAKVAVTWSATGGTVAPDGMYTADTVPGDFLVTATSAQLSLSASSRVHNRGRRPVASVTVSPASASVTVGLTAQLTATPRDANGNPLNGRSVTWVTGDPALATVNGSGLVMGVAAGSVTITATSEGKSGTAAVTVTASSGGGSVLFQETFENTAFGSRGWYDNTGMAITDTQHITGSAHALEDHFRDGARLP